MNKKYILAACIVVVALLGLVLFAINSQDKTLSKTETGKLSVTTSFYPLYFFASQIGGDKANVLNITPAGGEPHDYEPTPQDIINITNSKLLVLNGGGLESWGPKITQIVDPKKTLVITAGEGLTTQQVTEDNQTIIDPHVWLSPPLAQKMVDKITEGFVQVDSTNADYYTQNSNSLKTELSALDKEYQEGLSSCSNKNIITSHAAFGYLATDYNLNQVPITGLSPDAEPSLKQLGEITSFAKKNNVKFIFFESLVSPKLSEVVANEIGAKTMVLDPIEGLTPDAINSGKDYFSVMRQNLANLKIALDCKDATSTNE